MAIFNNGLKGNVVTGLGIGIGVALLGPVLIPVVANIAKPLAKAAIKGGVILYEKGREAVAETGEVIEDLLAEVKSELAQAQNQAAAPPLREPGKTEGG
jgi:hypothetical protein